MTAQCRPDLHINHSFQLGWLALATLTMLMLGGCSSNPVIEPTSKTKSLTRQDYGNNQSYNKPYTVKGKKYFPMKSAANYSEQGYASWYGSESGNRTATGSRFRPQGLTAAHKTLPLPCKVRVTNLSNGRSIDVIVNDRGPFRSDRLIDLSQGAAKKIGLKGLAQVKVEALESLADNDSAPDFTFLTE